MKSATMIDAQMMGWDDRIGSIEKGKFADLIAVSGDPLKDIQTLEHVHFVMHNGNIFKNEPVK